MRLIGSGSCRLILVIQYCIWFLVFNELDTSGSKVKLLCPIDSRLINDKQQGLLGEKSYILFNSNNRFDFVFMD